MKYITITIQLGVPDDTTQTHMNNLGDDLKAAVEKHFGRDAFTDTMNHEVRDEDGAETELEPWTAEEAEEILKAYEAEQLDDDAPQD